MPGLESSAWLAVAGRGTAAGSPSLILPSRWHVRLPIRRARALFADKGPMHAVLVRTRALLRMRRPEISTGRVESSSSRVKGDGALLNPYKECALHYVGCLAYLIKAILCNDLRVWGANVDRTPKERHA